MRVHFVQLEQGMTKPPTPEQTIEREFSKLSRDRQEAVLDRLGRILMGEAVG